MFLFSPTRKHIWEILLRVFLLFFSISRPFKVFFYFFNLVVIFLTDFFFLQFWNLLFSDLLLDFFRRVHFLEVTFLFHM